MHTLERFEMSKCKTFDEKGAFGVRKTERGRENQPSTAKAAA